MHRLVFAHQLRALAVMSVVASHLVGVYWAMPDVVAALTHRPRAPGPPPPFVWWIFWPHWQPGPFGVALFFLISGLVIPISLEHRRAGEFLVARVFRLLPVAACGQCLGLLAAHLLAGRSGIGWPPLGVVLANALLVYDWFGLPSLDTVNWSLCVEVKFYVLAAITAPAIRARRVAVVPALGLLCLGCAALSGVPRIAGPVVRMLGQEAVYLSFMCIGILFFFRLRGLSAFRFAAAVAGCGCLSCLVWLASPIRAQFPVVTWSYGEALAVFALAFALRRFARPFWPLDRLADISYPTYMTHSVLGYALIQFAMLTVHLSYRTALLLALGTVIAAATALHLSVERPGIRLGHAFGRRSRDGGSG
ncbi:MAG: acyltransferase [Gluconacetobacter diazotrophicus]|nr:acyltransferase [Gluconacetobacter diazotrophicus]